MEAKDRPPTKGKYFVHHRYSNDEYLIDERTYQYIMEYVKEFRYSIHMIPNDEYVDCEKISGSLKPKLKKVRINELVFE